jgi:hypothetical protein
MSSEYDFLATYSRRLRQVVTLAMVSGAVLAGILAMGLIIALPLQSRSTADMRTTTVSPAKSSPADVPSQKGAQRTADKVAETTTVNVEAQNSTEPTEAARVTEKGARSDAPTPGEPKAPLTAAHRQITGVQPPATRAASMRDKPPNETKNAMANTNEATPQAARENGSAIAPVHVAVAVETSADSSANSTDRRTQKKHAYKRKPQKTRVTRPSEDWRHPSFVDQGGLRQIIPMQSKRDTNSRAIVASGPHRFMWPFNFGQY